MYIEGVQNMIPQNVVLWYADDFELKAPEKQQIREKYSDLPSFS